MAVSEGVRLKRVHSTSSYRN